MIDKNASEAAGRFMQKLTKGGFTMSRSKNNEKNYDSIKQKRDSDAVAEFTETQTFQNILKLK